MSGVRWSTALTNELFRRRDEASTTWHCVRLWAVTKPAIRRTTASHFWDYTIPPCSPNLHRRDLGMSWSCNVAVVLLVLCRSSRAFQQTTIQCTVLVSITKPVISQTASASVRCRQLLWQFEAINIHIKRKTEIYWRSVFM